MGRQVALRGADVEPGAALREGVEALADERGEDLALDRDRATGGDARQHVRLEHVGAGVDQVGVDLLGPRLLEEAEHLPVGGGAHEAVAARVVDGRERDRGARAGGAVALDQAAEVVIREDVAVEHEERAAHAALGGEADGAGRAERLRLDRVDDLEALDPGPPRAELRLDRVGQVAAQRITRVTPARCSCSNGYARNGRSTSGSIGFGGRERERPKARALTAHEDDGVHRPSLPATG